MKNLFATLTIILGVLLLVGGAVCLLIFGFGGWGLAGLAGIPVGGAMAYFAQRSDLEGDERSTPLGSRSSQDPAEPKPARRPGRGI